jgi:hypothetical protein
MLHFQSQSGRSTDPMIGFVPTCIRCNCCVCPFVLLLSTFVPIAFVVVDTIVRVSVFIHADIRFIHADLFSAAACGSCWY